MKRKYARIDHPPLTISRISFLPCDICNKACYNYRLYSIGPFCYCCNECLEVIIYSYYGSIYTFQDELDAMDAMDEEY